MTLKKYFAKKEEEESAAKIESEANSSNKLNNQSGSEDLELTSHNESAMLKREPLQALSSDELADNTELEQAKEQMRNEIENSVEQPKEKINTTSSGDDDESGKKQ